MPLYPDPLFNSLNDLIGRWDSEVPASPDATTLLNILQEMQHRINALSAVCTYLLKGRSASMFSEAEIREMLTKLVGADLRERA